ncbi:MAG: hypothetical protein R6U46_00285 [Marinilabilia sp.]
MKRDKIIRQIITIFWALLGAIGIIFIVALVIVETSGPVIEWSLTQAENLKAVILVLALVGIPASHYFHSQKIRHLDPDLALHEKLLQFRNSFFVKIATMEALSILGLLGYMITADTTFLYLFALLFLAFLINRPGKNSIIREIETDETE